MIVINELVWDEYNLNHIQKHDVTQLEIVEASQKIESVLEGKKDDWLLLVKQRKTELLHLF